MTMPEPPAGSRIHVERLGQGLRVWLPPPGWPLERMARAGVAVLVALGVPGLFLAAWVWVRGMHLPEFLTPLAMALFVAACGAYLLWRVVGEAHMRWLITASSKGLEVTREGRGARPRPERIPLTRLQDINLRPVISEELGSSYPRPPLKPGPPDARDVELAIESDAGVLAVGAGLRRGDLEWVRETLRRALATRRDTDTQAPASGAGGGLRSTRR